MAYSSTGNPVYLLVPRLGAAPSTSVSGGIGGGLWGYTSSDPLATVVGSSYFSDGFSRGMRKYDSVLMVDTNSSLTSLITVVTVTSTSGGVTCASALTS